MVGYLHMSSLEGGMKAPRLELSLVEKRVTQQQDWSFFVLWTVFLFVCVSDMTMEWTCFCFDPSWSCSGPVWCCSVEQFLFSRLCWACLCQPAPCNTKAWQMAPAQVPDVRGCFSC